MLWLCCNLLNQAGIFFFNMKKTLKSLRSLIKNINMMAAYSRLKDLVRRLMFLASSWNLPLNCCGSNNCGYGTGFISYHFPLHTPRAPATQTTLIKELTHRSLDGLSTSRHVSCCLACKTSFSLSAPFLPLPSKVS